MPQAVGFAIAGLISLQISAAAATVIGSIAIGLVSFGAQILLRPGIPRQPGIRPSDAQSEIKQPLSSRQKSFGRVRKSGTVWWFDADFRTLYLGLALNHGRIGAILSYHIDENEVEIDGSGVVTTPPYDDVSTIIKSRLGLPTETAYAEILSNFGVADVRGDGVASLLLIATNSTDSSDHLEMYPGGRPQVRVTIEASVCFDPRDPAQDREDQSTWEWSENAAVVILNYLIDPDGYGMGWARIAPNLDQWIAAMDICDEPVDLVGGGTAARYRIAGTYAFNEDPVDVMAKMLGACDARIWQKRDGSIGIVVGKFTEPSVTIEDRDTISISMERGPDILTAVAGIRAQYMSPDHDYREHEAEPWPSGSAVLGLSEDRVGALDLSWVPSRSQARRLMKRDYLRKNAGWRGTIGTNLAGLRAIDERFIRVRNEEFGIDETFEIERFTLDPSRLTCQIDVLNVDASIDEWDPETEEGSVESGFNFGHDSLFQKSGTAVDPITEAGGVEGQTAIVFCAAVGSVSATPAGWTLIQKAGPTSTVSSGAFVKVLDGTETSTTFLGASGVLIVALFDNAPSPTFADLNIQITTSGPTTQPLEAVSTPYAILAFGACTTSQSDPSFLQLYNADDKIAAEEDSILGTNGTFSAAVKVMAFGTEETPFAIDAAMPDHGTNALMSFILKPGV